MNTFIKIFSLIIFILLKIDTLKIEQFFNFFLFYSMILNKSYRLGMVNSINHVFILINNGILKNIDPYTEKAVNILSNIIHCVVINII